MTDQQNQCLNYCFQFNLSVTCCGAINFHQVLKIASFTSPLAVTIFRISRSFVTCQQGRGTSKFCYKNSHNFLNYGPIFKMLYCYTQDNSGYINLVIFCTSDYALGLKFAIFGSSDLKYHHICDLSKTVMNMQYFICSNFQCLLL